MNSKRYNDCTKEISDNINMLKLDDILDNL